MATGAVLPKVLIGLVLALLMSGAAAEEAVNKTEASCLRWLTTLVHHQTLTVGAELADVGCFSTSRLGIFHVAFNTTTDRSWVQPTYSLELQTECAANCSKGTTPSSSQIQFAIAYGKCYCGPVKQYKGIFANEECCATTEGTPMPPSCTSAHYARVYDLKMACPLNVGQCSKSRLCEPKQGCCVPEGSVSDDLPFHVTMMQYMASFLMIAIVIQAIWWSVRLKMRVSRQRRDHQDGLLSIPTRRRTRRRPKEEALRQARFGITQFGSPRPTDLDDEAHCGICLDMLTEKECLLTSCGHVFHRSCMLEYLAHGLRSFTNDINCPMCRAILVVQPFGEHASSRNQEQDNDDDDRGDRGDSTGDNTGSGGDGNAVPLLSTTSRPHQHRITIIVLNAAPDGPNDETTTVSAASLYSDDDGEERRRAEVPVMRGRSPAIASLASGGGSRSESPAIAAGPSLATLSRPGPASASVSVQSPQRRGRITGRSSGTEGQEENGEIDEEMLAQL